MKRTQWTPEQYERAMGYKGRVSSGVAHRLTGIPAPTISRWWRGTRPKFMYSAAQRAGEYAVPQQNPLPVDERRRRVLETKRKCNKKHGAKYRARYFGRFHPLYNPDPMLAPFERLWLPADEVVAFIRSRLGDVTSNQFGGKDTVGYKRWYEMTTGRRSWLRYDTADALFCAIGLLLSEMSVEPVYSNQSPVAAERRAAA